MPAADIVKLHALVRVIKTGDRDRPWQVVATPPPGWKFVRATPTDPEFATWSATSKTSAQHKRDVAIVFMAAQMVSPGFRSPAIGMPRLVREG